jgi:streptomycin 6-kinase
VARRSAINAAREWNLELGEPFAFSNVSFVAPAGDAVIKVAWQGDGESLHEPDVLELWNGDGAVRLLRRSGQVLLEERALPGDDLSLLTEDEATAIAVTLAGSLWRPAVAPFRPVSLEVARWLDAADCAGSDAVGLARELLDQLDPGAEWVVHGDFHHHNIIRRDNVYVAIDPKPYLADREYDVPSFLWNPFGNDVSSRDQLESRIGAFVDAGLDDFRIRAWTIVRGAYLRPNLSTQLRALLK